MFSDNYDTISMTTLSNLMMQNGHKHIDLLKLDIEGAEVEVLNQMLSSHIYPTVICVEFDLKLKGMDPDGKTEVLIHKLLSLGYKIISNENWNITFYRNI